MHVVCTKEHLPLCDIYQHIVCSTVPSPVLPTVNVSTVESTADYSAGSNISLVCSWNTSVYYVAWYKDGNLLYDEDLAAPYVLMIPEQGIYVTSNFTMMMSTLTIDNATLDDSGNYTCAVTCGARGVNFSMIAANLQDTTEVFVYGEYSIHCTKLFSCQHEQSCSVLIALSSYSEPPNTPNGLSADINSNDTAPVTAVIDWMPLMDNSTYTGIPPGGNQTLRYFVEVSNSTSAVLFRATVDHPTNTSEAPNLPACENLTVSVTAENLFFNGTPASEEFMTVEPG